MKSFFMLTLSVFSFFSFFSCAREEVKDIQEKSGPVLSEEEESFLQKKEENIVIPEDYQEVPFTSTGHYQQQVYERDGYSYQINNVDIFKDFTPQREEFIQTYNLNWKGYWSKEKMGMAFMTRNPYGSMTKGIDITKSILFKDEFKDPFSLVFFQA